MDYDDIRMMYNNCICFYKNKAVFVFSVNEYCTLHLWDLAKQKDLFVKFEQRHFSGINRRIGMVNVFSQAFYVVRIPVRKYWNGINLNNVQILRVGHMQEQHDLAAQELRTLRSVAWSDAIFNNYPTYWEAVETTREHGGVIAFDKQFATNGFYIYYKTSKVGVCTETGFTFDPEWNHLDCLLSKNMFTV